MDITVLPHGRLNMASLAGAIVATRGDVARADLGSAQFVEPAGLVAVAALVDRAVREGRPVTFTSPRNASCRRYLSRMQLGAYLDRLDIAHNLGTVAVQEVDSLCELRWFGGETELEEVAGVIVDQYMQAGHTVVQPLYDALFELAVNAVQHSGQNGGFVALQQFARSDDVAFAIADSGVGIRQSLRVGSDAEAIVKAARKYESSASGAGRGRGITGVIALTGRHRGAVSFVTGFSQGEFTNGHWDPRVTALQSPFLGTLVNTRLSQRRD